MPLSVRGHAAERACKDCSRDAVCVPEDSKIATHESPAARERSNYIIRLDLTADGMDSHYEQMWTRTEDKQFHELCCVPFFTYGLSLGDVLTVTSEDGAYSVESKGGHRTIRFAVQDDTYAHEQHEELHGRLSKIGVLMEFRGHANGYCAIDIANQAQADAVVAMLSPLAQTGVLVWEWADPVVPD
jgi:hypothetical protein